MNATTARRTFAESTLQLADGTRIEYARTGAASTDAGGHIVFIHRWPDSWRSFEPVMSALPDGAPATRSRSRASADRTRSPARRAL